MRSNCAFGLVLLTLVSSTSQAEMIRIPIAQGHKVESVTLRTAAAHCISNTSVRSSWLVKLFRSVHGSSPRFGDAVDYPTYENFPGQRLDVINLNVTSYDLPGGDRSDRPYVELGTAWDANTAGTKAGRYHMKFGNGDQEIAVYEAPEFKLGALIFASVDWRGGYNQESSLGTYEGLGIEIDDQVYKSNRLVAFEKVSGRNIAISTLRPRALWDCVKDEIEAMAVNK